MNRDLINLIISTVASIVAIVSTFLQNPLIALIVFVCGLIAYTAYMAYLVYKGVPGHILLRFLPVLILTIVGTGVYYFWPSTLKISLYNDLNSNGRRDKDEPAVKEEKIIVTDNNGASRSESTSSDGELFLQIPRGEFRLKLRDFQILGDARRGENRVHIGFLSSDDKTPPQTRIFVGEELGVPSIETLQRKIYVHVWYRDTKNKIAKVELDWGEGKGWEEVDLAQPTMNYYILQYEYKHPGNKTIKFRVKNSKDISSLPVDEPMRDGRDMAVIKMK
jgi:hypothetical protein